MPAAAPTTTRFAWRGDAVRETLERRETRGSVGGGDSWFERWQHHVDWLETDPVMTEARTSPSIPPQTDARDATGREEDVALVASLLGPVVFPG